MLESKENLMQVLTDKIKNINKNGKEKCDEKELRMMMKRAIDEMSDREIR